jgi:hypothetical protein
MTCSDRSRAFDSIHRVTTLRFEHPYSASGTRSSLPQMSRDRRIVRDNFRERTQVFGGTGRRHSVGMLTWKRIIRGTLRRFALGVGASVAIFAVLPGACFASRVWSGFSLGTAVLGAFTCTVDVLVLIYLLSENRAALLHSIINSGGELLAALVLLAAWNLVLLGLVFAGR